MRLTQTYTQLPEAFYAKTQPTPVVDPRFITINDRLINDLGMDRAWFDSEQALAVLSGRTTLNDTTPIAQAYAGHQFGHWVPILGDGRALLLGEHTDPSGIRWDVQLKGAGPTPFSRNGDGRSSIGPVVREYLASEAMAALGIPTTRALAAISTGETVQRQQTEPGGILVRVAQSHVRIGTFEFFARQGLHDAVAQLLDYQIERHQPHLIGTPDRALKWFTEVIARTAHLVSAWMQVGFIHGVMNTDNCSVIGETIDYGPFGFLDAFIPDTVYSSIDHQGRYAYNQQPAIAAWNLSRLAECLLPLLSEDTEEAIEIATQTLNAFPGLFKADFEKGVTKKTGLDPENRKHIEVAMGLLDVMAQNDADMTLTFRRLGVLDKQPGTRDETVRQLFDDPQAFDRWAGQWRACLSDLNQEAPSRAQAMNAINPAFVLRNHLAQRAVDAAIEDLDFEPMHRLQNILAHPFDDQPEHNEWAGPPAPDERVTATFCGT